MKFWAQSTTKISHLESPRNGTANCIGIREFPDWKFESFILCLKLKRLTAFTSPPFEFKLGTPTLNSKFRRCLSVCECQLVTAFNAGPDSGETEWKRMNVTSYSPSSIRTFLSYDGARKCLINGASRYNRFSVKNFESGRLNKTELNGTHVLIAN